MTSPAPRAQPVDTDPFRSWDDDHTALVHVLWGQGIKGEQADELASAISRSRWHAATRHRAAGGPMLCQNGRPDGHAHFGTRCATGPVLDGTA